MGKNKHKGAAAAVAVTTPAVVANPGQPTAKVVPGVVVVHKTNVALRGARAAWYGVLLQYNGKPLAEFYAATTANPPSLPKSGKAENPTGWWGWFVRQGIAGLAPSGNP